MLADAALAPDPDRLVALGRAWRHLTGPGPELSSSQRHAVIADARAAWAGAGAPNPHRGVAGEAAHWLALDAEGLRAEHVADFEARGLGRWTYLEIVGIVGRLANIDWYVAALGASELGLPEGVSDEPPTGTRHADAVVSNMWVPTVGQTFAPHVLDGHPDEGQALRDLHQPMYVDFSRLDDAGYADDLTKAQIEYLAARTSYLNECFY